MLPAHVVPAGGSTSSKVRDQFFMFRTFGDVGRFAPFDRVEISSRPLPVKVAVDEAHLLGQGTHIPFDEEHTAVKLWFEVVKGTRELTKSPRPARLVSVDAANRYKRRPGCIPAETRYQMFPLSVGVRI